MANPDKKKSQNTHERSTKKQQHLRQAEAKQQRWLILGIGIAAAVVVLILAIGIIDAYIVTPNKAVAQVGDVKITVKEFQTNARYTRWQLLNQYNQVSNILNYFGDYDGNQQNQLNQIAGLLTSTELLGEEVLNTMIENVIIEKKAEELGITVSEAELDAWIQDGFGFYPDGTPTPVPTATEIMLPTLNPTQELWITPTPSAEELAAAEAEAAAAAEEETPAEEETVEEVVVEEEEAAEVEEVEPTALPTATPYTVELFDENYTNYLSDIKLANVNEEDFRGFMEQNILRDKVFDAITADVETVEEQVWARHILAPDEAGALSARGQLVSNSIAFEDMAMMFSTDTASAEVGGDLGWFSYDMMVEPFAEAAFSLEIGEISEPVESDFGFHLIQVLGKEVLPLEDSVITSRKNEAFATWLEQEQTDLGDDLVINEDLRSKFSPTEPSFNDPDVYEAFFGINPYDAQRTQTAYETQQAESFTVDATEVPAEEVEE